VNKRQKKTLQKIFEKPTRADITWTEAESLLKARNAVIRYGSGSVTMAAINKHVVCVHRPHPQKELKKRAVEALRDFFENTGITP